MKAKFLHTNGLCGEKDEYNAINLFYSLVNYERFPLLFSFSADCCPLACIRCWMFVSYLWLVPIRFAHLCGSTLKTLNHSSFSPYCVILFSHNECTPNALGVQRKVKICSYSKRFLNFERIITYSKQINWIEYKMPLTWYEKRGTQQNTKKNSFLTIRILHFGIYYFRMKMWTLCGQLNKTQQQQQQEQ